DCHYAVMEEEDLPATIQLALNRIPNRSFIVLSDDCLDWQPVVWWRLNRAHIPSTGEREVKCARDGCRAQRQHIHQLAQQLELFFVHDAEPLLFVNHHESEVLETDVVLKQPMGADHDVYRSGGQILHNALLLAAGAKPGKQLDPDRVIGHPFTERVV